MKFSYLKNRNFKVVFSKRVDSTKLLEKEILK